MSSTGLAPPSEGGSTNGTGKRPRPTSTIVLEFSEALDGAFNLGGELGELQQNVEQRKLSVNDHNKELQELEARLKAAEERLTKAGLTPPPPGASGTASPSAHEAAATTDKVTQNGTGSSHLAPPARAPPVPHAPAPQRPAPRLPTQDLDEDEYDGDDGYRPQRS